MAEDRAWRKCRHGEPFSGDFAPIAQMAKATRGEVANIDQALRDCASQAPDCGSVADFNLALAAAFFEIKLAKVQAIVKAMRELGIIDKRDRMPSFDRIQELGSSAERVRQWRAKKKARELALQTAGAIMDATPDLLHETDVTPVTQSQSQSRESESEKRLDSADSARAGNEVGAIKADERALEVDCRALVEGLPVMVDTNFVPVLRLLDAGMTRDDVLGGIREAIELRAIRARSWSVFERFIREKAKDRLERAAPHRSGGVIELKPRAGPAAKESALARTIRQLEEIRAEDAHRAEAAS